MELSVNLITENTGISIALVISLGGAVWWAAAIQTKMDVLIALVKDAAINAANLNRRVDKVELDIAILQQKKETDRNG